MIESGYFNSINGDRKYNAEKMSKYFAGLFSKGVVMNYGEMFSVKATTGMIVEVGTGKAYFTDGKWIESDSKIRFTIDPSDVVLNRIDSIVLVKDRNESKRNCNIVYKKGTPSSSPIPPKLTNDENIEEMQLCTIKVNKLVESITQSSITNTIPDNSVCGYITGLISHVSTEDLFKQWEAAYQEYYNQSTKEFEDWFSNLRENLSTSTLIRQYKNVTKTTKQDQKVIDIGIPQFNPVLDILDVYINGMYIQEGQTEGQGYTKTETQITLNLPLELGQDVYFVVFKSIDGEKATTVIEQVEELQGKKADKKWSKVVLMVSDWVLNSQDNYYHLNAPVTGVGENDILIVSPDPTSIEKYSGVIANSQSAGYIDFKVKEKPTETLYVNVLNLGLGVLQ